MLLNKHPLLDLEDLSLISSSQFYFYEVDELLDEHKAKKIAKRKYFQSMSNGMICINQKICSPEFWCILSDLNILFE